MTWLYLPSNCAPESECSAKVCEPHSTFSASDTAPFATWNGKPLLPPSLPRLWKQERSIRRLSGLISSPSEAATGAARWIASLPDSRARTSASPVGARGSMASAPGCSSTSSTSPTLAVRGASLWRTSAPSLLPPPPLWTKKKASSTKGQPPASWENWPTAGGTRSGSLFPRPMWEPATGAQGGSASHGDEGWMTPSVSNSQGNEYTRDRGIAGQERPTLTGQANHWLTPEPAVESARPTPRGTDGTKGGPNQAGSKGDLMLPSAAAQWPTPAARDYRSERGGGSDHGALQPASRPEPAGVHRALPLFAPGPADPCWGDILNARGFGAWSRTVTDDAAGACPWAPATQPGVRVLADGLALLVDESRNHQLRQVGNGVVATQAAVAFILLIRRAGWAAR